VSTFRALPVKDGDSFLMQDSKGSVLRLLFGCFDSLATLTPWASFSMAEPTPLCSLSYYRRRASITSGPAPRMNWPTDRSRVGAMPT
jgi:hypothetical protein